MKKIVASLILLLAVASGLIAQSSVSICNIPFSPMQEMITESKAIVHARVLGVEIYWNEEHTKCYNHYRLLVIQAMKGKLPSTITVVTEIAGPDVDERCVADSGLNVGSNVIACLEKIPADWECGYTPRHAFAPYKSVQGLFLLHDSDSGVTHAFHRYHSAEELYSDINTLLIP
jgi:hypothetical protein